MLELYRAALRVLEDWGISIPPGSRLRHYESRLDQVIDPYLLRTPEDFLQKLAFDLREIDEVIQIVSSFASKPDAASYERLRFLPAGNDAPDADTDSQTRDFQYGLFLRAVLRDGGLKATISEPDLRIRFGKHQLAVEAKRPRSEARFDDRLRKAVQQLRTSGLRGIIAMSLDHVIRPKGKILTGSSRDAMVKEVSRLLVQFVSDHGTSIARRVESANLAGMIFTARMPSMIRDLGQLPILTATHTAYVEKAGYPWRRYTTSVIKAIRLGA